MKVAIIEDEERAANRLRQLLTEINPSTEVVVEMETVREVLAFDWKTSEVELIFLDIHLADGSSFEIFNEVTIELPIIFTTAYDQYAIEAFQVNSIDYLLKPIDEDRLQQSLSKLEKVKASFSQSPDLKSILRSIQPEEKSYKNRFLIKQRDRLISIKTAEIAYWFTEMGIVYIMTLDGNKWVLDKPLDQLEGQLNPEQFFRLNRQCIANIEAVSAAHPFEKGKILIDLMPKTSNPTIVSREKASDFKKWMGMG